MTVDELVEEATRRSGVPASANDSYREGLGVLVDGWGRSRLLGEQGYVACQQSAVDHLVNRLKVDDYIARRSDLTTTEVSRPVFVMGMPRTGTTMVSYLLGADPARRSLLTWEVSDPIPPATSTTLKTDPRCLARLKLTEELLAANPDHGAHFEPGDGPTECVFVHSQDFKSLEWETMTPIQAYFDFMMDGDLTSAYAYEKRMLQALQSQAPGVWNLKAPSHALNIRALLKVFPDARLIWTHRDPFKAAASLVSISFKAQGVFCETRDLDHIVRNFPRSLGEHVARPMAVRAEGCDIYDLYYADLLRDPMGEMRKLYAWLGDDFTPDAEAGMRAWLLQNPQHKHGAHAYDLERFGMTEEHFRPSFKAYLDRYPVEREV